MSFTQRRVWPWVSVTLWPSAGATPRTDEEEPGGAVQRAGGEEASVRGWEGQLGGSAENPGAAETGRLQVSNTLCNTNVCSMSLTLYRYCCSTFHFQHIFFTCLQHGNTVCCLHWPRNKNINLSPLLAHREYILSSSGFEEKKSSLLKVFENGHK